MNRNVNSEEGLHSCGYHDGKRAAQLEQLTEKEKISREMTDEIAAARALAQPAQEPVDWEQIYWDMVNAMLRDKLRAQPAQEPVAMVIDGVLVKSALPEKYTGHLYTTPPQRTWVGLTDEEIKDIIGSWGDTPIKGYTRKLFDQIEAKLKEKNNG